jgi:hypothetical protein
VPEQKYQVLSGDNAAILIGSFPVYRASQFRLDRLGAILRVAGDSHGISTETFDLVVPAFGLDVDH